MSAGLTAKTLAEYARAQGVEILASDALQHYQVWKREHPAEAAVFEAAHRLQDRASTPEPDRCAWPACRDFGDEVRYLAGSTPLTESQDANFCAKHHSLFLQALAIVRGE